MMITFAGDTTKHNQVPEFKNPAKSVVIVDNTSRHKKESIYNIADEYGFMVLFLPANLPDLNPIENFWANVKRRLRLYIHLFSSFDDALLAHAFF